MGTPSMNPSTWVPPAISPHRFSVPLAAGFSQRASAAFLCVLLSLARGDSLAAGYRFNAPQVLNLSSSDLPRNHPPGRDVPRHDGEKFLYAGRLSGSGYHRVEVRYGHDSPGSFLINPFSGKTAYAHNGSDVAVLSPSGERLLVFDTLNPPFALAVASLSKTGPTIEVQCRFAPRTVRVRAGFSGWRDDTAFELVFTPAATTPVAPAAIPARVEMTGGRWVVFTPESRLQQELPGFACQEFGTR